MTFALIPLDATLFIASVETVWSRVISTLVTPGLALVALDLVQAELLNLRCRLPISQAPRVETILNVAYYSVMAPASRVNFSLDDITIEALDMLEQVMGSSKSEIVRRGVQAYWFSIDKMIEFYIESRPDERRRAESIEERLLGRDGRQPKKRKR